APDIVVSQTPPAKAASGTVALLVNRGERGASYVMPDLIGANGDRAAEFLREHGFRVAVVGSNPYPGVAAGIVIRQSPQGGFQVGPVEPGAAMMSVHVEVLPHLHRTVQAIKALGAKAGVVLNPSTPVVALEEIAGDVDYVLVMSVNPGFGGQTFIPRSESKVREVRALLDRVGNGGAVEIDGGIDRQNVARVVAAGARIIVAGSAIFHSSDPERATRDLKAAALGASAAATSR